MQIGIPKETYPGETRVALIPDSIPALKKAGHEVVVEKSAGLAAGFTDSFYEKKGAILSERAGVFSQSDILFQVRTAGANPEKFRDDLPLVKKGQIVIGFCEPLNNLESNSDTAESGISLFSMELMPRITRAQSMDALSSMATIAGYRAVLLAASNLPRLFPMLMTAAGTIAPAKVLVIGAGVAGLQAIASSRRLGAVVRGYDVRPAVREQVESLGAKFVEMELEASEAETKGGYAREMDENFYKKQRELMQKVVAESDVVITTAAIPGKKAPVLITEDMLHNMQPGSVIVDLAAERGGNCESTKAGQNIKVGEVLVMGPENLPASIPYHASQMYAKNITTFFKHLTSKGEIDFTADDEILKETLVTHQGQVVHPRLTQSDKKPSS